MRYIKQLAIILAVTFVSELLHSLIPLPFPAGLYGLVLMLVLLCTHVVKLPAVEETGDFLLEIMPLMFIPAEIGLIRTWVVLKPVLIPAVVIAVVSTYVVMAVAGHVTQAMMRRGKRGGAATGRREEEGAHE